MKRQMGSGKDDDPNYPGTDKEQAPFDLILFNSTPYVSLVRKLEVASEVIVAIIPPFPVYEVACYAVALTGEIACLYCESSPSNQRLAFHNGMWNAFSPQNRTEFNQIYSLPAAS